MSRLVAYLLPHRKRLLWGWFLLLCTNATTMAMPQLFRAATDLLSGVQSGAAFAANAGVTIELKEIALTLLFVALAGAIFRVRSRVHLLYAARDVEEALRRDYYAHLTRLPPAFFQAHATGDLMSRATHDLTQVRMLAGPGILNIVNTAIAYATAVPLMALLSVKLTLLALAVYLPGLWLVQRGSRRLFRESLRQQEAMGRLGAFVQENLSGAHVVRAFGVERGQAERFAQANQACYDTAVRLSWTRSTLWRLMAGLAGVGVLLVLWQGALDVMAGQLTLGGLVAMTEYLALLAWPSFALGWVISVTQRGLAAFARIGAVLDTEPPSQPGAHTEAPSAATIEVASLTLAQNGRTLLDNVSFVLGEGKTLGVVGPLGSGKSSLVRALLRLVDVSPGQIRVGGVDITELEHAALRSLFGVVPQQPMLFSMTVAQNIAFGRRDAPREVIQTVVRQAAFERDLAALPHGLDTEVGERGVTLSGGQQQRVAIARALLLDPKILVLDDALSSVDAETELEILTGLKALRLGKTTLIVAHRITAVAHADEIIVLEKGRVVERGTHAALLARDGFYATMARLQELERDLERNGEAASA